MLNFNLSFLIVIVNHLNLSWQEMWISTEIELIPNIKTFWTWLLFLALTCLVACLFSVSANLPHTLHLLACPRLQLFPAQACLLFTHFYFLLPLLGIDRSACLWSYGKAVISPGVAQAMSHTTGYVTVEHYRAASANDWRLCVHTSSSQIPQGSRWEGRWR